MRIATALVFVVLGAVGLYLFASDDSVERGHGNLPDIDAKTPAGGELSDLPPRLFVEIEDTDQLFADMTDSQFSQPEVQAFLADRLILEYRIVSVNSDQLRSNIREFPAVTSFDVRLLDSEPITLVTSAATEHSEGWQSGYATWVGGVDGDEASSATLFVAPDGSVNGQVRTIKHGRVKIENIPGTSAHLIWKRVPVQRAPP